VRPTPTEQIDAFCDQVWLQDGLAPSSLASYRRDLTQWAGWLGRRSGSLLTAQRGDVEAFLAEQFRAKAKATSIARRLSSLRRFYALQLLQGTLRTDPTLDADGLPAYFTAVRRIRGTSSRVESAWFADTGDVLESTVR